MHLTRMRFSGVPPFTGPVEFSFDEQVNVFVGANATGKSRLLSAIDEHFNKGTTDDHWPMTPDQMNLRLTFGEDTDYFNDWTKGKNLLCADQDFAKAYFGQHESPSPPVIYIGPTRIGLPSISELGELDSLGSTAEEVLSGQFSGARLNAAIELLSEKTRRMFEEEQQEDPATRERRAWNFNYVDEVSHSCAQSICEELIARGRALNYPTGVGCRVHRGSTLGRPERYINKSNARNCHD